MPGVARKDKSSIPAKVQVKLSKKEIDKIQLGRREIESYLGKILDNQLLENIPEEDLKERYREAIRYLPLHDVPVKRISEKLPGNSVPSTSGKSSSEKDSERELISSDILPSPADPSVAEFFPNNSQEALDFDYSYQAVQKI